MFHHRSAEKDTKPAASRRNKSKGRVETTRTSIKKVNTGALSKQDRINALRQVRQSKREELLERRRLGADEDSGPPPPKVIALVPFHTRADALSLKRRILASCGADAAATAAVEPHTPVTTTLPAWAQQGPGTGRPRVMLVDPPRDVMAVMDVAKCADVVLCVLGPHASLEEPAFDTLGYKFLTALKSQGMPSVMGAVHGSEDEMPSAKKAEQAKKFVIRYFASELGAETKLVHVGTDEEVKVLVRSLAALAPKDITWRSDRGYMMAQDSQYSPEEGVLCLRGYVRGPGFRCKHLVHLTGHGDFSLARIARLPDPCPLAPHRSSMSDEGGEKIIEELRQGEEPDSQRLQPYDPTMEEQTWPTEEELGAAGGAPRRRRGGAVPAPGGAVPAPGGSSNATTSAEGSEADADMGTGASSEAGDEGDEGSGSEGGETDAMSNAAETEDGWDVSSNMTMEVPNSDSVAAERRRREVLIERSQEELEFPDEVDTPLDIPAKERFQRYRGLKSFRTSPWDPYEDLPVEYSRIWEFEAFPSTARALREQFVEECYDLEGGGVSTYYCALYLRGVPQSVVDSQQRGVPFVLSTTFPCEQKVSVMHGTVTRLKEFAEVMKSKQEFSMHCGFRRFVAKPTFSEAPRRSSQNRKFKFLRFLHQDSTACASFYAPVVFPPCRLLVFSGQELAASGSITGVDPKQIIIKRVCLTGYPFKTHKSKGVVRFMFFSPADVRWFKPVELSTKKGLRGHITESLGTHGYMKCRFNQTIKQDDTVCMNLYKRVYPKWYPPAWGGKEEDGPEAA